MLSYNPTKEIIETIHAATTAIHFQTITEDFSPGYPNGNVKTHKNSFPLRPIISQCPTPIYYLAKRLNSLISPYVSYNYSIDSSAEFLSKQEGHPSSGKIVSLDVESFVTNEPVGETIDLILERVYRDPSTPTLNNPEEAFHTLLEICTRKDAFTTHRGQMYMQKNGVAMESPHGVLFASSYMEVVEERVFSQILHPDMYVKDIDDTFVMAPSIQVIETLQRTFEE
ncbi:uncharacterized protein [Palaemon carinicauda]|uniref:uncharacterized protein n=1 Tax=Palaemon carinicauda TaxID=392227 RepID=UPI0035B63451